MDFQPQYSFSYLLNIVFTNMVLTYEMCQVCYHEKLQSRCRWCISSVKLWCLHFSCGLPTVILSRQWLIAQSSGSIPSYGLCYILHRCTWHMGKPKICPLPGYTLNGEAGPNGKILLHLMAYCVKSGNFSQNDVTVT